MKFYCDLLYCVRAILMTGRTKLQAYGRLAAALALLASPATADVILD